MKVINRMKTEKLIRIITAFLQVILYPALDMAFIVFVVDEEGVDDNDDAECFPGSRIAATFTTLIYHLELRQKLQLL